MQRPEYLCGMQISKHATASVGTKHALLLVHPGLNPQKQAACEHGVAILVHATPDSQHPYLIHLPVGASWTCKARTSTINTLFTLYNIKGTVCIEYWMVVYTCNETLL